MKTFLRGLVHAALGAAGGALAGLAPGVPITSKNVLYPVLGSVASSLLTYVFEYTHQQPATK